MQMARAQAFTNWRNPHLNRCWKWGVTACMWITTVILNCRTFSNTVEDIINWRTARINGRTMLTLVVLRETVEEEDGFGFKDAVQYRVLAMEDGHFICRVYRKAAGQSVFQIDSEYMPERAGNGVWMKSRLRLLVLRIMITR